MIVIVQNKRSINSLCMYILQETQLLLPISLYMPSFLSTVVVITFTYYYPYRSITQPTDNKKTGQWLISKHLGIVLVIYGTLCIFTSAGIHLKLPITFQPTKGERGCILVVWNIAPGVFMNYATSPTTSYCIKNGQHSVHLTTHNLYLVWTLKMSSCANKSCGQ